MDYKVFKDKISYLESQKEKYGFLLDLSQPQLNKLKNKLNDYDKIKLLDYKGKLDIPEEVKEIKSIFEYYQIDYDKLTDKEIIQRIRFFIEIETKKLYTLKTSLYNLVNILNIFDYESIKRTIKNGNMINQEKLNAFKTETNNDRINKILELYNKLDKTIFNSRDIENSILLKEEELINYIDDRINSICFNLNIEYQNKSFIEKYFTITDIIETKISKYNKMLKDSTIITNIILNIEQNLTKEMKEVGYDLELSFEQIKYLVEKNIDKIIEEIKMYQDNKIEIIERKDDTQNRVL